jgi:Protein of unknown function (DUF3016)
MRLNPIILAVVAVAGLGVSTACEAGSAEVSFTHEARFSDAGASASDRASHLAQLANHLKRLAARHLPGEQKLSVELLDVDLAGSSRPWRGTGTDVRVLRGRADWPRIELRYTLSGDGNITRTGTESIADLNYLQRINAYGASEPLKHEKRMLDDWFRARFVEGRTAD